MYTYEDFDEYLNMLSKYSFNTKVVGSTFIDGAQQFINGLVGNERIELIDEPNNPFDKNAIALYIHNFKIGYVRKELAVQLKNYKMKYATILAKTGDISQNVGLNIKIYGYQENPLTLKYFSN